MRPFRLLFKHYDPLFLLCIKISKAILCTSKTKKRSLKAEALEQLQSRTLDVNVALYISSFMVAINTSIKSLNGKNFLSKPRQRLSCWDPQKWQKGMDDKKRRCRHGLLFLLFVYKRFPFPPGWQSSSLSR